MLGVVTLYNSDPQTAADNILRYARGLDFLIVWDNSSLERGLQQRMQALLTDVWSKTLWHGTGKNQCIAPAVNFAWQYAKDNGYDLLLIMDQDSQWHDFDAYRREIESHYEAGDVWVYTPYVEGMDVWEITEKAQHRRFFINSGTVIPVQFLNEIGGADETFALDALDHNLSIRILKRGHEVYCLTSHKLTHTLGAPTRSAVLRLYTPDYGRERTYSIVRSHIINYRAQRKWMTREERVSILKEFVFWKFVRIILAEHDKWGRLKMYMKGLADGLRYDISKTKS